MKTIGYIIFYLFMAIVFFGGIGWEIHCTLTYWNVPYLQVPYMCHR